MKRIFIMSFITFSPEYFPHRLSVTDKKED